VEPHEELKLAWELELMSVTIDKTRLDIEEARKRFDLDMEDARIRWNKHIEDGKLAERRFEADQKADWRRFKLQVWTTVTAAIAAGGGYLTWWTTHFPH
jgi:hypothetical protein